MPAAVLIVRHGLTVWNEDGRWQGWADIALAEAGEHQASSAAQELAAWHGAQPPVRFGRIVTSPLRRARHTADAIADALSLIAVHTDADFRERHIGDWSGHTTAEIDTRWPGALAAWRRGHGSPPNGEDEAGFRRRIWRALSSAAAHADETGEHTLIVAHGGVIRTLELLSGAPTTAVANLGGRWFHAGGEDEIVAGDTVDLLGARTARPASVVL